MKIHDLQIENLKEYKNNPRNNDSAVNAVAESIKEFGFKVPVVVDSDYVIVAGHTRVKAAKQLGLETVPCIIADDLTPEQVKAYRLADNKVGELATWDFSLLEKELEDLAFDIDMELFGFDLDIKEDVEEIDDIKADMKPMADHVLSIDRTKVIMTEDEYEALIEKYNDYVDEMGVSFGFVGALLNG